MSVYIYIYIYIYIHTVHIPVIACSLKFQTHHHCLEPSCQNSFSSWSSCCLINFFFWGELCPIFSEFAGSFWIGQTHHLVPKSPAPAFHSLPEMFLRVASRFRPARSVSAFFLGRSCFSWMAFGKGNQKSESEIQVFLVFFVFILCILYNIKLIWTPHKECMKKFSGSRHLSTPTFGLLSFGQQAFFFRHLRPLSRLGLSITKTPVTTSPTKRPGAFVNSKNAICSLTAPFFPNTLIFPNAERKEI